MTLLRARKPTDAQPRRAPSAPSLVAGLVVLGLVVSSAVNNIDRLPIPALAGVRPALVAMLPGLQAFWLMHKIYLINGHVWRLASMTPVTDFDESEMVFVTLVGHHRVWANRARGVEGLGDHPHAFDRLYLELQPHVYAALRWRDTPDKP